MGGSVWSDDFYNHKTTTKKASGAPTFGYHSAVMSGAAPKVVHDSLNIKGKIRESRDSDAHPDSTAIAVLFDVTGSMSTVPRIMQEKLPKLMNMLLRKGYIKDPQVCFGAVGDFEADRVPLQVGQFESGVEMDDDLTNVYLESGGGGQKTESYQTAMYYFAHRTSIDCFEKRGKKGYFFLIGDEMCFKSTKRKELDEIIGIPAEKDATTEEIVAALKEKYNVFFILPKGTSYFNDPEVLNHWKGLFGPENVIKLQDPATVCETIGLTIGLFEGTASPDSMTDDLKDLGTPDHVAHAVASDLDHVASSTALAKVGTGGTLPEKKERSTDIQRL